VTLADAVLDALAAAPPVDPWGYEPPPYDPLR